MPLSPPPELVAYKHTAWFTEHSVPSGLLSQHRTKDGVWGRIEVEEGHLRVRLLEPALEELLLGPGEAALTAPGQAHEVAPVGAVRFRVVFLRSTESIDSNIDGTRPEGEPG